MKIKYISLIFLAVVGFLGSFASGQEASTACKKQTRTPVILADQATITFRGYEDVNGVKVTCLTNKGQPQVVPIQRGEFIPKEIVLTKHEIDIDGDIIYESNALIPQNKMFGNTEFHCEAAPEKGPGWVVWESCWIEYELKTVAASPSPSNSNSNQSSGNQIKISGFHIVVAIVSLTVALIFLIIVCCCCNDSQSSNDCCCCTCDPQPSEGYHYQSSSSYSSSRNSRSSNRNSSSANTANDLEACCMCLGCLVAVAGAGSSSSSSSLVSSSGSATHRY